MWSTPTVHGNHNVKGMSPESGDGLATQAALFILPGQMTEPAGSATSSERRVLNPRFVETLMGLPIGWTDSELSATEWSHWWQLMRSSLFGSDSMAIEVAS